MNNHQEVARDCAPVARELKRHLSIAQKEIEVLQINKIERFSDSDLSELFKMGETIKKCIPLLDKAIDNLETIENY